MPGCGRAAMVVLVVLAVAAITSTRADFPLAVRADGAEVLVGSRFGERYRTVEVAAGGGGGGPALRVVVEQDWDGQGLSCALWPAGELLARHLARHHGRELRAGARVLELGTGTGIVGLACAALGASVVATDLPEVITRCTARSLDLNPELAGHIRAAALPWGETELGDGPGGAGPFDLIVGADLAYTEDRAVYERLVRTLVSLSGCSTTILISGKIRYRRRHRLFRSVLKSAFRITRIDANNAPGSFADAATPATAGSTVTGADPSHYVYRLEPAVGCSSE